VAQGMELEEWKCARSTKMAEAGSEKGSARKKTGSVGENRCGLWTTRGPFKKFVPLPQTKIASTVLSPHNK